MVGSNAHAAERDGSLGLEALGGLAMQDFVEWRSMDRADQRRWGGSQGFLRLG